jgi:hypothetical protein
MEETPRVGERAVVSSHRADRYGNERLTTAYRCLEAPSPQPDTVQDRPKRPRPALPRQEVLT